MKKPLAFLAIVALCLSAYQLSQWLPQDPMVSSLYSDALYRAGGSKMPRIIPSKSNQYTKYGFIDTTGKIKITPQYNDAGRFSDGLAAVKLGKHWGYINDKGAVVIPLQYQSAKDFSDGLAAVRWGKLWGYVDRSGNCCILPRFNEANKFHNQIAIVSTGYKFGLIDRGGRLLVPLSASKISIDSQGIARILIDGKVGLMADSGKWICQPKYTAIGTCSEGRISVCDEKGQWGYIDTSGASVIAPKYKFAHGFWDGAAVVGLDDGRTGIINRSGAFLLSPAKLNLARIVRPDAPDINADEMAIVTADGLTPYSDEKGHWGYLSAARQEPVIKAQYIEVNPFSEGLACVGLGTN